MKTLVKALILLLVRVFYRTRVFGTENIPREGGAVLVANHQSYLDAVLITLLTDRPIRFVISQQVARTWFVAPFAKLTNSIPIEQSQSPRELIKALREASKHAREGGLVCIFPEGQITRMGMMMPFRRGIERIMKDLDAPIVPIAIDGAFETGLSYANGGFDLRRELRWRRHRITLVVGKPLEAKTPLWQVRQRVVEQVSAAFEERHHEAVPLHRAAIAALRAHSRQKYFADAVSKKTVPNSQVLAGIVAMGRKLKPVWGGEEFVGVMLPPSIGGVVINVAALLAGKVPVNLNYTVTPQILAEICANAGVRVIVTSRLFMEKIKLELPEKAHVVYLEDVRESITGWQKFTALLAGLFQPVASLERALGRTKDATVHDIATLVYSSGSTGTPKGVVLTHWNITSNILGACLLIRFGDNARLMGILPFFHSFGLMVTLWLPMVQRGVGVSYHVSPLDGRTIGAVIERDAVTHLLATPTFLSIYSRTVMPHQFGSLRMVMAGAEKLRAQVSDAFLRRFGLVPQEGFGCTECSPVVSLNAPDWRSPACFQQGTKQGTVGHPAVGVCVRIVDPATGEPKPPGESGMLLVRGPNVMPGYYKNPEKTSEALKDGWYITGDIAKVDEEGFITITDRLSRFSKIGGEMVPHIRVEEALHTVAGVSEVVFAVAGVPDAKKGEKLAVLYSTTEAIAKKAAEDLSAGTLNLPALWVPKWQDFIKVEALPTLGTGKLDLQKLKKLAQEGVAAAGRG